MPTTPAKRAEVAQRRANAIELKRAGASWSEIADQLGYAGGKGAAQKDVSRALEHMVKEPAEQLVAEQLSRLDAMLTGLWPSARRGNLGAVDRVLRLEERRAKLLGLDRVAETRGEVTVSEGAVVVRFATAPLGAPAPPIVDIPAGGASS